MLSCPVVSFWFRFPPFYVYQQLDYLDLDVHLAEILNNDSVALPSCAQAPACGCKSPGRSSVGIFSFSKWLKYRKLFVTVSKWQQEHLSGMKKKGNVVFLSQKYKFQEMEEKQQKFDCSLKTPNKISLFWGVKILPFHPECGFKQKKKPCTSSPVWGRILLAISAHQLSSNMHYFGFPWA